MGERKKILILGAGPAGLAVAKRLVKIGRRHFEIILVDQEENFNFLPRLFGEERPVPYRKIAYFLGVNFAHAEVIRVDLIAKTVFLKSKISNAIKTVPYDYLIFALGGEGNFYQIPGLEKRCYNLYSLPSARALEEKLSEIFKKDIEAIKPFDLVIGGAGATGVETAILLADYFRKQNWDFLTGEGKIYLYEARENILADWPDKIRSRLQDEIHFRNIALKLKKFLAETLGTLIAGKKKNLLVWAGGLRGSRVLEKIPGLKLDTFGRVITNDFLELISHSEVKIIGSCLSGKIDGGLEGIFRQADVIASNFYRSARFLDKKTYHQSARRFYYLHLPGRKAVVQIGPILLTGFCAWLASRIITLYYLVGILPFRLAWRYWKKMQNAKCKMQN